MPSTGFELITQVKPAASSNLRLASSVGPITAMRTASGSAHSVSTAQLNSGRPRQGCSSLSPRVKREDRPAASRMVPKRLVTRLAVLGLNDLSQNGERDLGGISAAELKPDWRMQTRNQVFGEP